MAAGHPKASNSSKTAADGLSYILQIGRSIGRLFFVVNGVVLFGVRGRVRALITVTRPGA